MVRVFKKLPFMLLILSPLVWAQLRDPTQPAISFAKNIKLQQTYQLNSILVSPHRRYAIINGEFVKPGDMIAGAKVVSMTNNRVILLHNGKVIKLYLLKEIRRRK